MWDWSSGSETPLCTSSLSVDCGPQHHLVFHPSDNKQLVSTGEDSVVFYTWVSATIYSVSLTIIPTLQAGDKMRATSTLISDKVPTS